MPNYRRHFLPGGTYFFTQVADRRAPIFSHDLSRQLLRDAIRATAKRWPFQMVAIVLLPDHLHTLWTLPPNDADYSRRWAFLKKEFTKSYLATGGQEQPLTPGRLHDRRRGIWQPKFWEHTIRDDRDFENHLHYIHYNPVKHGLVTAPRDWPHSTFSKWVKAGVYEEYWCDNTHLQDLPSTQME